MTMFGGECIIKNKLVYRQKKKKNTNASISW